MNEKNIYLKNQPAGGVAQVVEHLPSKCEAPSTNPSVSKKKKKSKNQPK
jgi:hypothetical protein